MLIEFIIVVRCFVLCYIMLYIYILFVDGIVFCLRGGCCVLSIVLCCFVFVDCALYFL
jgi:hypothetical protein